MTSGTYKSGWKPVVMADYRCRKCGGPLQYRDWEYYYGEIEQQFKCDDCNYTWWVEGPDA